MKKVMIINDSKFESVILKDMLLSLGYNVDISDENNIMRKVSEYAPDCVIINYVLKDVRGDELATAIKMINSEIKCIIQSSNVKSLNGIDNKRVDAVFLTPVNIDELSEVISKLSNSLQ